MKEPDFLSISDILEIHRDQVSRYGGPEGIRDLELLKSALGMPASTFGDEFLHSNPIEMAAAYLFHIVNNHPFLDGNKRTGAVAAIVFLDLNGIEFNAPENDLAEAVLAVSNGKMDKAGMARFIQKWSQI